MDGPSPAETLILQFNSGDDSQLLFDGDHRAEAERYLRAVEDLRRLSVSSDSLQVAMDRLEDEFRHVLVFRVNDIESDLLFSDLSSHSLSLSRPDYEPEDESEGSSTGGSARGSEIARGASMASGRLTSATSIAEIDLAPSDAVHDLRSIAEQMLGSGYETECLQAYVSVRKSSLDDCLRRLGVERLSISDVHDLPWEAVESKIRRWIHAARAAVRVVFASERRLCDLIFEGLTASGKSAADVVFDYTVKPHVLQLFGFAEAIGFSRRSPEKIFKIIDLHDAIRDLLPDIQVVLADPNSSESQFQTQVNQILSQLATSVRGIVSEFEVAIYSEQSASAVRGGTIHPITRYVMNYIGLICDYNQTLTELITSGPSLPESKLSELELPETDDQSPLAAHLTWIIAILISNLQTKSELYNDSALAHIFLMNNIHYIVQKAKVSPELREMVGDKYLKKLTGRYQKEAVSYHRAAWVKVLHCLRDEGIHVGSNSSSGISKKVLQDRFKSFNTAFDESHRTQSLWLVPDVQLREELRILISERLVPAYRFFLGRYRQTIESGRHPELYLKYTLEDLANALDDFFEGGAPTNLPLHTSRRKRFTEAISK